MAEDAVVKEPLSDEMKAAGEALTNWLQEVHVPVQASFWWHDPDASRWSLIIASSAAAHEGPRKVYGRIYSFTSRREHVQSPVNLSSVTVVPPSDRLVSSLSKSIRGKDRIHGVRLSHSTVGDLYVHDAYIYKLE